MQTMAQQQAILGGVGVCDRCRGPLDLSLSGDGTPGSQRGDAPLGDSYVVLPHKARAAACAPPGGSSASPQALPDLSHTLTGAPGDGDFGAPWSTQLRTVSRLMDLAERMSDKASDAAAPACGVPLCQECGRGLLLLLQQQLEEAHMEREALQAATAELYAGEGVLDGGGAPSGPSASGAAADVDMAPLSVEDFERERAAQRQEEAALREELAAAAREKAALQDMLRRLRQERASQKELEAQRHAAINGAEMARQRASEEELRAEQLIQLCEGEARRLEGLDVLSDAFRIEGLTNNSGIPGGAHEVGTINGLRLGRASGANVEWAELNAAIGQVVLLAQALCRLHMPGGEFAQYTLVPHGSHCRVFATREPNKPYDLFGSGQLSARLFGGHARGVEKGQALLLACVDELVACALASPLPATSGGAGGGGVQLLAPHPPVQVAEVGSLVGANSAGEGRKLLAVLAWLLEWSSGRRRQQAGAQQPPESRTM